MPMQCSKATRLQSLQRSNNSSSSRNHRLSYHATQYLPQIPPTPADSHKQACCCCQLAVHGSQLEDPGVWLHL
jgi:hypothetical protein